MSKDRVFMFSSFFYSRLWIGWAWGGLTFLLFMVYIQVQLLVVLNTWFQEFYDLLQRAPEIVSAGQADQGLQQFWAYIIDFAWIVFPYIFIAVISQFLSRHFVFRWRQAMTFSYIDKWSAIQKDIEGSSQRIQEDTQRFARIVENLGLEFFESILKILAFIPILWTLSSHVSLPILSAIPGSLVWLSLCLSVGGIVISWFVGIKLPGLEYNNQKVEAAFRKQLVYGEDDKAYADPPTLVSLFRGVRHNYFRLFLHYGYFDTWRIFFLQSASIVPFVVMGPSLFTGAITLGVVIQAANAFDKVNDSFSYFLRSWTIITELRSVVRRLHEFEYAIAYTTQVTQTDISDIPILKAHRPS